MAKGKKVLKIACFSCLGLIVIVILSAVVFSLVQKYSSTYNDLDGNTWQKYQGDKSTPTFTVFGEQGGVDQKGKIAHNADIQTNCDPKKFGSEILKGDYIKGIARPNHCVVSNSKISDEPSLDFYILLSDGSLISLAGNAMYKIQININDDGIKIIQAEGKAYYRIQKQPEGKKFVIQVGDQTFTAVGTETVVSTSGSLVAKRTVQMAVMKGSVEATASKSGFFSFMKKKHPITIKERQKVQYTYNYKRAKRRAKEMNYTTITPMTMAETDTLITDKFTQKQIMIFVMVFMKGVNFNQIKELLPLFIAFIQNNNQQAVDEYLAEQRAESEARIKRNSASGGSSGSASGATSATETSTCPANTHAVAYNLCCPNGTSLATDQKCYKDSDFSGGSGSGSGSGGTSCPPANIPRPDVCYKNAYKNGKYMCDYGNFSGYWLPACIPSSVRWE